MALIQIKGKEGGRDRRGLISLGYSFLIDDVEDIEALTIELPVSVGVPEVDRKITEWRDNNSFIIKAVFEGITSDPAEDQDQYLLQGEEREEPIEAFSDREALMRDYGAYEDPDSGRLRFPETLEKVPGSGGSALSKEKRKSEKNPLFGVTTYPIGRWTATRSYVRRTVPQSVYSGIWRVTDSLPAGFDTPPDTTWIKIHPLVRKRGNCSEIIERWKDLKELKHLEALMLLLGKK